MLLLCDSYPFSSNVSGQSAVSSIYSVNYIEYADGFEPMAACGERRWLRAALAVPDECGRGYASTATTARAGNRRIAGNLYVNARGQETGAAIAAVGPGTRTSTQRLSSRRPGKPRRRRCRK